MATKKKTKFGQGLQIKINVNSTDKDKSSRQLIVNGEEKCDLNFKDSVEDQEKEPYRTTRGERPMPKVEYFRKLDEILREFYLKPDEPCDLDVMKTDEFPFISLRNKDTYLFLSKFLDKVVDQKPLTWPPFLGYKICTRINKKMKRCAVLKRLNEDQILGITVNQFHEIFTVSRIFSPFFSRLHR